MFNVFTTNPSVAVISWYVISFLSLVLNKFLLGLDKTSPRYISPTTLGFVQMVSTAIYGLLKEYIMYRKTRGIDKQVETDIELATVVSQNEVPNNKSSPNLRPSLFSKKADGEKSRRQSTESVIGFFSFLQCRDPHFLYNMVLVGFLRFATVILGLLSLQHVAASFTETIKSTAPVFTVFASKIVLKETYSIPVYLSLIPVMAGLFLSSYHEVSFDKIGFTCAILTCFIESFQNVYSKRLLSTPYYTPFSLQCYTSLFAIIAQVPIWLYSMILAIFNEDFNTFINDLYLPSWVIFALWLNGLIYHLQSVIAYCVMNLIKALSVSVLNTLKRSLIIFFSILLFGNAMTFYSILGTFICISGSLAYNLIMGLSSK